MPSQDQEVHDMYQPYFFAEFENTESLDQIPAGRQTIQLEIPVLEKTLLATVGIDDVLPLLRPEDKVDGPLPDPNVVTRMAAETASDSDAEEDKPTTRTIDVWIERSSACSLCSFVNMYLIFR